VAQTHVSRLLSYRSIAQGTNTRQHALHHHQYIAIFLMVGALRYGAIGSLHSVIRPSPKQNISGSDARAKEANFIATTELVSLSPSVSTPWASTIPNDVVVAFVPAATENAGEPSYAMI